MLLFRKKLDPETEKLEQEAKEEFYKKVKKEAYKKHLEQVLTARAEADAKKMAEDRYGQRQGFGIMKLLPKVSEQDKKAIANIGKNFASFYENLGDEEAVVIAKKHKVSPMEVKELPEKEETFDAVLIKNMKKRGVNDMSDLL